MLLLPFTPRNKDNLIGLMLARCDGEHLGEIVVLQLSKQELIFGPAQIAARINQEQTISKDLTLWNQQGSHVLRAQTLVLPVDSTFLYVDSIYIQSSATSMPQLKKIVLAVGNRLIYTDTFEQALAQLSPGAQALVQQAEAPAPKAWELIRAAGGQVAGTADQRTRARTRSICGGIGSWPRRANGRMPAKSWRLLRRRCGRRAQRAYMDKRRRCYGGRHGDRAKGRYGGGGGGATRTLDLRIMRPSL